MIRHDTPPGTLLRVSWAPPMPFALAAIREDYRLTAAQSWGPDARFAIRVGELYRLREVFISDAACSGWGVALEGGHRVSYFLENFEVVPPLPTCITGLLLGRPVVDTGRD